MFEERDLEFLEHIAATAVGSDDKILNHRERPAVTDVVVHVASAVVGKEAVPFVDGCDFLL